MNYLLNTFRIYGFVILFLSSVGIFFSCNKYEEGPVVSLRSKNERIANTWKPEWVVENGTNVTSNRTDDRYTFTKGGSFTLSGNTGLFSTTVNGTWQFINDKDEIQLIFDSVFGSRIDTYKILKLKENELWIRNETTEIHLVSA